MVRRPRTRPNTALRRPCRPDGNHTIPPVEKKSQESKVILSTYPITQDDIDCLNRYQQDAYGTVGISIGPQQAPTEWTCHKCHSFFASKHGLGFHQASAHAIHHIANIFLPGTLCLACRKETHCKSHLRRHLTSTTCLHTLRFWYPQPHVSNTGIHDDPHQQHRTIDQSQPEVAKGVDIKKLKATPTYHHFGPRLPPPPRGWVPPPPPLGYVDKAYVQALAPDPSSEVNLAPLTPAQIQKYQGTAATSDITPFLGPLRIIFFMAEGEGPGMSQTMRKEPYQRYPYEATDYALR